MKTLSKNQIKNLLQLLTKTKDRELNCEECLQQVAEYAEQSLAGSDISKAMALVEQHLSVCQECEEEYQALLSVLKTESDQPDLA